MLDGQFIVFQTRIPSPAAPMFGAHTCVFEVSVEVGRILNSNEVMTY